MAADVEVVIFGISGVGVGYEMTAERHVDANIARPLVGRRPIIQEQVDIDVFGKLPRNTRVDHVDNPADGRGAEQQRPRSA